jgi:hypothetical protein
MKRRTKLLCLTLLACALGAVLASPASAVTDITPPTTTASGLSADNHSGWRNSAQTVTLSATDETGGSGVAFTYYTIDGAARQTYTTGFSVSAAGSHTITYWSVDAAANVEAAHSGYVNIDTTPPLTTASGLQKNNHSGWRTSAQTVSLSSSDTGGSGVAFTYYTIDGGGQQSYTTGFSVSAPGSHTITYWSVDAAANVEAAHSGYVNIRATSPPAGTSVTLSVSPHTVIYGAKVTLSGTLSTHKQGETVHVLAQACGEPAAKPLVDVTTTTGGAYTAQVQPLKNTIYTVKVTNTTSSPVTVKVRPRLSLARVAAHRYVVRVYAAQSFAGKYARFQRYNAALRRWVGVRSVLLRANTNGLAPTVISSRSFTSRIKAGLKVRIVLGTAQVGSCYLAGMSRTIRS